MSQVKFLVCTGITLIIASIPLLFIDAEFTVDVLYPVDASKSKSIIRSSESLVYYETSTPTLFLKNLASIPSSSSL